VAGAGGNTEASRAAYDELVVASPQGSVFSSSWWLDAVAGGRWRPHGVEGGDGLVAAWPTVVTPSRLDVVHAGAPMTPSLGPLFAPGDGAEHRRRSREAERLDALLAQLGPHAHVEARCSPAFDYWTPLAWHGFSQTTNYTWRLADLCDLERVLGGARENVRREVRKAKKRGLTVGEGSLDDLLAVHQRAGADARTRSALLRVDAPAGARGAREVLVARDGDGRVHFAGYFVHDARWTYYLVGASDPELRTSGAPSLVMWAAIERAASRGTGFDFEGSMLRHVERFVRAFGGTPAPYSIVWRSSSRAFAALRAVKRLAHRARRS
jgi:hypothetical protein